MAEADLSDLPPPLDLDDLPPPPPPVDAMFSPFSLTGSMAFFADLPPPAAMPPTPQGEVDPAPPTMPTVAVAGPPPPPPPPPPLAAAVAAVATAMPARAVGGRFSGANMAELVASVKLRKTSLNVDERVARVDPRASLLASLGALGRGRDNLKKTEVAPKTPAPKATPQGRLEFALSAALQNRRSAVHRGSLYEHEIDDENWL